MNIRKALEKMNEEAASSSPAIGTSPSNRVDDQTFFGDTQAVDNSGQFKYFAGIGDNPPVFDEEEYRGGIDIDRFSKIILIHTSTVRSAKDQCGFLAS